jgi:hypothetical protein
MTEKDKRRVLTRVVRQSLSTVRNQFIVYFLNKHYFAPFRINDKLFKFGHRDKILQNLELRREILKTDINEKLVSIVKIEGTVYISTFVNDSSELDHFFNLVSKTLRL